MIRQTPLVYGVEVLPPAHVSNLVIVNVHAEGFMAVNLPTPRARPEGKVRFTAINPSACTLTIIYPT